MEASVCWQICRLSVCLWQGTQHTLKVLHPASSKVSQSKTHAYPLRGLQTSFMKNSDSFPVHVVKYWTVQRTLSVRLWACLDRCSGDLCDHGCFKGSHSDHMTKPEWSRVKEMSTIQGQNEAVGQESIKEKGRFVLHWQTAARLILTKSGISQRGELDGSEECRWLGNSSGAWTHKLNSWKLLRVWCYRSALKPAPNKKSSAQTCLPCLQNCVTKKTKMLNYNCTPSIHPSTSPSSNHKSITSNDCYTVSNMAAYIWCADKLGLY